jgi:hypothetical protein
MSEQQQTSAEQIIGRIAGQFSAIDGILQTIGTDVSNLVRTCVTLTTENTEMKKKIAELTKKKA